MKKLSFSLPACLLAISMALSSCGLPVPPQKNSSTSTPTTGSGMTASTDTVPAQVTATSPSSGSVCDNDYFPSDDGSVWTYTGTNSKTGDYTRTDTVSASSDNGFTIDTQLSKVDYTSEFSCTDAGLITLNPAQGDLTSLLSGPNGTVVVTRNFNSGITIPKDLKSQVGQMWQQVFGWDATSPDVTTRGEFTFYYTAMGLEVVTVPYGTFDAMRIDARIDIEIGTYQKSYGTYNESFWLVKDVGMVKSEGSMKMSGVEFTDSIELVTYDSP